MAPPGAAVTVRRPSDPPERPFGTLRYDFGPRLHRGRPAAAPTCDRMPTLAPLFPYLLAAHVALAIALFVPSLLLPFTLRNRSVERGFSAREPGRFVRALLWLQSRGTVAIGGGLAFTGIGMLTVLGPRILEQPWLLVSLATYAATAAVAFAVQRPGLRRLQARAGIATDADRETWRAKARRQRYVAYAITTAVGLIAFLMSTKPALW